MNHCWSIEHKIGPNNSFHPVKYGYNQTYYRREKGRKVQLDIKFKLSNFNDHCFGFSANLLSGRITIQAKTTESHNKPQVSFT